jgi:hypothetical protein
MQGKMMDDEEDFGFSFFSESDIEEKIEDQVSSVEVDFKRKLALVESTILPFLEKLRKDPEKIMIKWPNRKEVVDKQIEKLLQITRV